MDQQDSRLRRDRHATTFAPEPRATGVSDDIRAREIRAEIEDTRDDLSETVNAIQERLRPGTMVSNAAESVKDAALDKARDVAESEPVMYVRANPTAVAMIGVGLAGLGWLMFGGRNGQRPRSRSRRNSWERDARAQSQERYRQVTNQRSSGRDEFAAYAQTTAQRAWDGSPLLVGAGCVVLGAILGLAVPETERENQLMGETRDEMLDTVQDTMREKMSGVQQAATEAVSTVQDAATRAVGLTSDGSTNDDDDVASRV